MDSNYPRPRAPIRFHTRFFPFGLRALAYAYVLTTAALLILYRTISVELMIPRTFSEILVYLGFVFFIWVACRLFFSEVSEQGLRTYNGVGIYSVIPWEGLTYGGTLNLGGFKYHRFKRDRMLWSALVPFDLADPSAFVRELGFYLGERDAIVDRVKSAWGSNSTR